MMIRQPARAGMFYAADGRQCRAEVEACVRDAATPDDLPAKLQGGIVPHAGWICSGAVAATTFAALALRRTPSTVVVFGAAHRPMRCDAAAFAHGAWATPLGEIAIDERLAERVLGACPQVRDEPYAHEGEHSIEVQVPFVQRFWPQARLLPILVMPGPHAPAIGRAAGRVCVDSNADVVFVGSTDLTHYGPGYGATEHGIGEAGLRWAKEVNDRRMIDVVLAMQADEVVPEARRSHNACGSGAIAACIEACRATGSTEARLLRHTSSYEVLRETRYGGGSDAVGYTSIVFGAPV